MHDTESQEAYAVCPLCGFNEYVSTLTFYGGKCYQCWNFTCRECGAFLHENISLKHGFRKCERCKTIYITNPATNELEPDESLR